MTTITQAAQQLYLHHLPISHLYNLERRGDALPQQTIAQQHIPSLRRFESATAMSRSSVSHGGMTAREQQHQSRFGVRVVMTAAAAAHVFSLFLIFNKW